MYLEQMRLTDRIAVVTGAGRGIGLEIARALGEAGAAVIIVDINETTGREAAEALNQSGIKAEFLQLDVTNSSEVQRVAAAIMANHGRVDVLVNNAGYADHPNALECSDEIYYRLMRVNLDGVFFCCREFGRYMTAAGRGAVVNIGSMSGLIVNKPQPQAHYNTSKAGVHMLTKSLACEWAQMGVRVNAVAPGLVSNEASRQLNPDAYLAQAARGRAIDREMAPDDLVGAVLFLASPGSDFMSGQTLVVDGGAIMS